MAGTSTPATTVLTESGVDFDVHTYQHDSTTDSYGDEAARHLTVAIGVEPAQIYKTLVVRTAKGGLAVAVVPVPARLSLKAVAAALEVGKVVMADRAEAERSTGYVFGGISPLGQRKRLPTVIDESALLWPRVLCSGGRRGLEIDLAPADLIGLTGATVASIRS